MLKTGFGVDPYNTKNAVMAFTKTAEFFGNENKSKVFHYVISFTNETAPTAESAMELAKEILKPITDNHLAVVGVHNKDRDGEYYGILKYAEEYNIPAVIIEHCHLDEERDSEFWNEESYKRFGEIDADCVAKFYSLSSPSLGIDNSSFQNIAVEAPSKRLDRDYSEPEYCTLQIKDNGDTVTAHIEAYDPDNYIQYYQVSLDGGDHFGRLEEWTDRSSTSMEFDIPK